MSKKSRSLPSNQLIKLLKKPKRSPGSLKRIANDRALRVAHRTVVQATQTLHRAVILLRVLYQVLKAIKSLERRVKIINPILRIKLKKASLR